MNKNNQYSSIYVVNIEKWKQFVAVRQFFVDYFGMYDDDIDKLKDMNLPTFEAAGVSKKNLIDLMSELREWAKPRGNIGEIKTPPETVDGMFTVEVNTVDFYDDILKEFVEVLGTIDMLSFRNSGNDSVLIDVCVKNVWETIEPNE